MTNSENMKICEANFELIFSSQRRFRNKLKFKNLSYYYPFKVKSMRVLTSPGRVPGLEDVEDIEQLFAQGSLPSEAGLIQFFRHKKIER
jgi:hypothetical protein